MLDALREGGKPAMARALNLMERRRRDPATIALLDAAFNDPRGHILGLTGPPGVGKSTLTDALIRETLARGGAVGVIAVDPSSRKTGGALLGDRTRLSPQAGGERVFVRSMAARGRLGGLSALTFPAAVLMRAVYDLVIIETVGVGQSEMEIADIADTVALCVQPGAGDSVQFLKAGIMETPHIAVVTKGDLGAPARRAAADLRAALTLASPESPPLALTVSALDGDGIGAFLDAAAARIDSLHTSGGLAEERIRRAAEWVKQEIRDAYGVVGLSHAPTIDASFPFAAEASARATLHAYFAI